jgi:serine/threonine protein phosphatase PrpC
LILALLDAGQLWVGNVGDSRAVFGNDCDQAVPMSYDHKPCQLKEKKRIQEAGGFVAMNGVWRVMGVLATSRALGDYPLKVLIINTQIW